MGKTASARPKKSRARRDGKGRTLCQRTWMVVTVAALALGLHVGVIQGYRAPSRSMEDTVRAGDCLLIDKWTFGARLPFGAGRLPAWRYPQVGEIVVFQHPRDPNRLYVKRCLAVAGQVVEIRDKVVYVDGARLADPPFSKYVDSHIFNAARASRDNFAPRRVPTGSIFVVGDNRDNSRDSRHWGFLPLDRVVGRPVLVYWSIAPTPVSVASVWQRLWDLEARIRWQRIGDWVE